MSSNARSKSGQIFRVLGIVLRALPAVVLYLVLISAGINELRTWNHLKENGVKTSATVLDVEPYRGGRGVRYEFTIPANGETAAQVTQVWERVPTGVAKRMKAGDVIVIYYDPSEPSNPRYEQNSGFITLFFGMIPIFVIAAFGIILLRNRMLEARARKST